MISTLRRPAGYTRRNFTSRVVGDIGDEFRDELLELGVFSKTCGMA